MSVTIATTTTRTQNRIRSSGNFIPHPFTSVSLFVDSFVPGKKDQPEQPTKPASTWLIWGNLNFKIRCVIQKYTIESKDHSLNYSWRLKNSLLPFILFLIQFKMQKHQWDHQWFTFKFTRVFLSLFSISLPAFLSLTSQSKFHFSHDERRCRTIDSNCKPPKNRSTDCYLAVTNNYFNFPPFHLSCGLSPCSKGDENNMFQAPVKTNWFTFNLRNRWTWLSYIEWVSYITHSLGHPFGCSALNFFHNSLIKWFFSHRCYCCCCCCSTE